MDRPHRHRPRRHTSALTSDVCGTGGKKVKHLGDQAVQNLQTVVVRTGTQVLMKFAKTNPTLEQVTSETPPTQECRITYNGDPYAIQTYTAAQAKTALTLGSPQQFYNLLLAESTFGTVKKFRVGRYAAFIREGEDGEITIAEDATTHASRGLVSRSGAGVGLALRVVTTGPEISDESDKEPCEDVHRDRVTAPPTRLGGAIASGRHRDGRLTQCRVRVAQVALAT